MLHIPSNSTIVKSITRVLIFDMYCTCNHIIKYNFKRNSSSLSSLYEATKTKLHRVIQMNVKI